jgi:hypothetical protein
MQAIRATVVGAALLVSTAVIAQGSGGVTPRKHVNASKPSTLAAKPAPASAPTTSDAPDVKVNEFMSYNADAKTVKLKLNSAHGSNNGGMNFNGGFSGNSTITIPVGWSVSWNFTNEDAIPHSAIVLVFRARTRVMSAAGSPPARPTRRRSRRRRPAIMSSRAAYRVTRRAGCGSSSPSPQPRRYRRTPRSDARRPHAVSVVGAR